MEKRKKKFLIAVPAALLIFFVILEIISHSAAAIFNIAMEEQNMLLGKITVKKIQANPFGEVTFTDLLWQDEKGGTILEIPEGSFKVKIFDVITKNFQSTTMEELSLKHANVSVTFDENMNVDFIRHSQDFKAVHQDMKKNSNSWEEKVSQVNKTEEELKEIGEKRRQMQRLKIEQGWKNFNLEERKINCDLKLENCQIEIFYKERHYLLGRVNFETKINTDDEMTLKVRTGVFGGTMIGRGLEINGKVDFKSEEIPKCSVAVMLREVDPSSLGFGMNIHDKMTLTVNFTGSISNVTGDGKIQMDELHIPGMDFNNVDGKIHYEDSMLTFTDVTADVYKGKLSAHGDYNLDTRYYNIYGHGNKLKTSAALPQAHLHCDVDLDFTIQSKGNAKTTVAFGNFISGKGRYRILMFNSLSGKVRSEQKELDFYDVAINMGGYKIATDALSIKDKKLTFSPIKLSDENGKLVFTYER